MVARAEQERVRLLLKEAIPMLCKNGLSFSKEFCIEALVGITLDQNDVFLVSIKETVKSDFLESVADNPSSQTAERTVEVNITKQTLENDNITSLNSSTKTNRKRQHSKSSSIVLNLDSDDEDDGSQNDEEMCPIKKEKRESSLCQLENKSPFITAVESIAEPSLPDLQLPQQDSKNVTKSELVSDTEDSKSSSAIIIKDEPITDEYLSNLSFGELSNQSFDHTSSNLPYAQGSANASPSTSSGPSMVHLVANRSRKPQEPKADGQTDEHQMVKHQIRKNLQPLRPSTSNILVGKAEDYIYYTGQGPKKWICAICSKVYSEKANAKTHILAIHLQVEKYKCEGCSKRFKWHSLYKLHKKTCTPDT